MADGVFRRSWDAPQKRRLTPTFTPQVFAARAWPSAKTAERVSALYAYQAPWKPPQARHYAPLAGAPAATRAWPSARVAARAAAYGAFQPLYNVRHSYKTHEPYPPAARAWPSARIAQRAAVAGFEAFHPPHNPRLSWRTRFNINPPAVRAWPSGRIAERTSAAFETFRPPHFLRLSWRARFNASVPAARAWPSRRIAERVSALGQQALRSEPPRRFAFLQFVAPFPAARIAQRLQTWGAYQTDFRATVRRAPRFGWVSPARRAFPSARIAHRVALDRPLFDYHHYRAHTYVPYVVPPLPAGDFVGTTAQQIVAVGGLRASRTITVGGATAAAASGYVGKNAFLRSLALGFDADQALAFDATHALAFEVGEYTAFVGVTASAGVGLALAFDDDTALAFDAVTALAFSIGGFTGKTASSWS